MPRSNKPQPHYLPTPKEIRDECRRVHDGWSEDEHWKRAGYRHGKPAWEVPRYGAISFVEPAKSTPDWKYAGTLAAFCCAGIALSLAVRRRRS